MDDDRTPTSSFLDDDLDLDFEVPRENPAPGEATVRAPRRLLRRGATDAYRPARPRTAPNWSRIGVAALIGFVVLAFLWIVIGAVLDSRRTNAYRTYFEDVAKITVQSDNQGRELADLLAQPAGQERAQLVTRVEALSDKAGALVKEAEQVDAPDEMAASHAWFETALRYRQTGLDMYAQSLADGLSSKNREASGRSLAEASWRLVASDVIYADSYAFNARKVLGSEGIRGVQVPASQFVLDNWEFGSAKNSQLVLDRLIAGLGGTTTKGAKKAVKGVHGTGLDGVVTVPGGQALSPDSLVEVQASDDLAFEVTIHNQGEHQEVQVPVTIELRSENGEPQDLSGVLDVIDPGEKKALRIPVSEMPTLGESITVTVSIGAVPGEKNTDNNAATYQVTFTL